MAKKERKGKASGKKTWLKGSLVQGVLLCLPGFCFCGRGCGISGGDAIKCNDLRDVN